MTEKQDIASGTEPIEQPGDGNRKVDALVRHADAYRRGRKIFNHNAIVCFGISAGSLVVVVLCALISFVTVFL